VPKYDNGLKIQAAQYQRVAHSCAMVAAEANDFRAWRTKSDGLLQ
jgi:hypothetical protein